MPPRDGSIPKAKRFLRLFQRFKIGEIGMMQDYRLWTPFYTFPFFGMHCNNMHHFSGDTFKSTKSHSGKRMAQCFTICTFDKLSVFFCELDKLSHIMEKCTCDQSIVVNRIYQGGLIGRFVVALGIQNFEKKGNRGAH